MKFQKTLKIASMIVTILCIAFWGAIFIKFFIGIVHRVLLYWETSCFVDLYAALALLAGELFFGVMLYLTFRVLKSDFKQLKKFTTQMER